MTEYMNKSILGNDLEAQVVGEEFRAGAKELAAIRKGLKLKKAGAPDFPADYAAAAEAMVSLGQIPYVRPTADGKFVCIFEDGGLPALTLPQETAPGAVTCALYHLVSSKSPVT